MKNKVLIYVFFLLAHTMSQRRECANVINIAFSRKELGGKVDEKAEKAAILKKPFKKKIPLLFHWASND